MVYLDWNAVEDKRIEEKVRKNVEANMGATWHQS